MSLRVTPPRLLPMTIFAMAGLLAVKSVELVRAAAPAQAAEPAPHALTAPSGVAAEKHPGEPKPAEPKPAVGQGSLQSATSAAADPLPSDSERTLLLELRQRRQELEARDAALSAREAVLAAAEGKLSARVDELQALQSRLEALETARKSHEEENWRGLVKLYESMKPREAAAIFNDLDMQVLLQVVDRMKEAKAGAVMAAMQPDKARLVTTELAQMRTRASSDARIPDQGSSSPRGTGPKPGTGS